MQRACVQWGGAAAAAVLALLMGAPLRAADDNGVRPVAEELGQRTKPEAAPDGAQKGGLSDSAVRVLMTYAFSIVPDETPGADGKALKVDKSDPNKFLIPTEDARRVIRVATRSAYAEVCELPELEKANYRTLMKGEEAKNVWTREQMLAINALHMFAVSYFTGSIKITTKEEGDVEDPAAPAAAADGSTAASVSKEAPAPQAKVPEQGAAAAETIAPARPQCSPDQKQKVMNAINAYVQAAEAPSPQTAQPGPAASGSN